MKDQLDDLEIKDELEKFKIKLILELIRQGKTKKEEQEINIDNINLNKINNEQENNNKAEEVKLILQNKDNNLDVDEIILKDESKINIYLVIEIYDYDTSQNEITRGFKNPMEEFKNICEDFNIEYENELSYINYNRANKIKLTSFVLWGTKEGLYKFFNEKNLKIAKNYFFENGYYQEKKAGICKILKKPI